MSNCPLPAAEPDLMLPSRGMTWKANVSQLIALIDRLILGRKRTTPDVADVERHVQLVIGVGSVRAENVPVVNFF